MNRLASCDARALNPLLFDRLSAELNPIHIRATGMEPAALKHDFGRDLVFWGGGMDTQGVLPTGAPQQVKQDVWRNVAALAPGGGCVFNTIHNIQTYVPATNALAMVEALREVSL